MFRPQSTGRRPVPAALALALALLAPLARPAALAAHEGHAHKVLGTVTAITDDELTVRDRAGEAVAIRLTAETRYFQGDQEAARSAVEVGGRVAVSTSGGLLSKGHPLGATGVAQVVEAVEQLRGESGPRQVKDARIALTHCQGFGGAAAVHVFTA